MASSLRKKRNFKALQLPSGDSDIEPTRVAPMGPRARPAPLADLNNLLTPVPDSSTVTSAARKQMLTTLEKFFTGEWDLNKDELKNIQELGMGNGGSVIKVEHVKSGTIMAKKIVLIDAKPSVRRQIERELQVMKACASPFIVSSYGAYVEEPNVCICMEYMDKGSFDGIYKRVGSIEIGVVGLVARSVLEGLSYLYEVHKIIHRDIKPSNILLNSRGEIKLCDFGVSGELINSIAHTFVGTSIYMSPERIQGAEYSIKSDVWSLGITIIELAHGRFPFNEEDDEDAGATPSVGASFGAIPETEEHQMDVDETAAARMKRDSLLVPESPKKHSRRKSRGVSLHGSPMTLSIIELMHRIVNEDPPRLSVGRFPKTAEDFVDACLNKNVQKRVGYSELMSMEWIVQSRTPGVDLAVWAEKLS